MKQERGSEICARLHRALARTDRKEASHFWLVFFGVQKRADKSWGLLEMGYVSNMMPQGQEGRSEVFPWNRHPRSIAPGTIADATI
jgi:hypothetical protein